MYEQLRALARSHKYRTLYSLSQDLHQVKLLDEMDNMSPLQIQFLSYVRLYHNLYEAAASGDDFLTEERIKDDFLIDAYLVFKAEEAKRKRDSESMNDAFDSLKQNKFPNATGEVNSMVFLVPEEGESNG